MNSGSRDLNRALRLLLAACFLMSLGRMPLFADGVVRTIEQSDGVCRVVLAWDFTGKTESDLVIEERLAPGWIVDSSSVPFIVLDAGWFSGSVARFAVKPALLARAGAISFIALPSPGAETGTVSGDWKIYLSGSLKKGATAGDRVLEFSGEPGVVVSRSAADSGQTETPAGTAIAVKSFKLVDGAVELSYAGAPTAGVMLVEGCGALGKSWTEIQRIAVVAGDGMVRMESQEAVDCRFFRLRLLTEEK